MLWLVLPALGSRWIPGALYPVERYLPLLPLALLLWSLLLWSSGRYRSHRTVPVLDEAWEVLGPKPGRSVDDEFRTYGHIVVDEAQDLSPMQLRMLTRRSLNGSMTIVGDIAQSTGAWAHAGWDEILDHLPDRRPPRMTELTVGYRIPGPSMALAARILREAAPELRPPVAVRTDGDDPQFVAVATNLFADGFESP